MLFFFLQQEIDDKNAEREEEQLHLRQDGDAVAVDVVDDRVEERGVHGWRLLDLRRRCCNRRGWRKRAIRLVKAVIHLLNDALHRLFDVGDKKLWVHAEPEG